ncbi:hypothetical protein HNR44_001413 [Geomicrobium halophilum]|uniref:Uncharacterized protein n=1 Tax=Geomicrobium halophilum TaxID=549000 RepID=A0A841PNU4_9BACL|nr:hypothetical protein [Geomicrobium halophilum]MBB6449464.1 hypothetical protein [Geomicrobium halophilum]
MRGKETLRKAAAKSAKKRGILSNRNYEQWLKNQTNPHVAGAKQTNVASRAKKALLKRA